jgi:hypothetical protein
MQTATLKVAIQLGICNCDVGHRLTAVAIAYRSMATMNGPGCLGTSIAVMASTRWYAENVAASATMRYRGTEMFMRPPHPLPARGW